MRSSKVVVLGLDGATFRWIHPLVERGDLPNLKAILREGAHGTLLSVPNCNSAPAWTSMTTGVNPGKHGVFHLVTRVPGTSLFRPTNGGDRRCHPFWKWIGEAGGKVIVMNVPITYPAEPVNGALISGSDTPGPRSHMAAYPSGLMESIRREVGPYEIGPRIQGMARRGRVKATWERLRKVILCHERTILHLMSTRPWDLVWVVFTAIDAAQHHFWGLWEAGDPGGEILPMVYKEMDRVVGEIRRSAGPEGNLFLVSDHGAGPRQGAMHLINELFRSCGLLQARRKPGDLPFRIAKKAFLGLQDNIPIGIQEALARFFPVLFVRANSMRLTQGVDLKRSLAHAQWDSSEVHLARSTAPEGEVGSSDAPSHGLLTRVIELLGTLYDPNARAGVRPRIWRASELYHGPFTDLAADLLLRWDGETLIREVEASEGSEHYRAEGPRDLGDFLFSGTHRPEGILMAAGPDVKAGERVSEASVCDIAPTLLRLLGLPVPEWMDGRVLQELLMAPPTQEWHSPQTQGLPSAKTPSSGEPYSRKEREAVLSRFRDWGYLD